MDKYNAFLIARALFGPKFQVLQSSLLMYLGIITLRTICLPYGLVFITGHTESSVPYSDAVQNIFKVPKYAGINY